MLALKEASYPLERLRAPEGFLCKKITLWQMSEGKTVASNQLAKQEMTPRSLHHYNMLVIYFCQEILYTWLVREI